MDLDKLVSFSGRTGRGAYWLTSCGTILLSLIAILLMNRGVIGLIVGITLYVVGIVIALAAQTKRWHDRDKSGWWCLIAFVPVIGGLWALIETGFLPGTPGGNQYGSPASGSPFTDDPSLTTTPSFPIGRVP
jgi:uncharacterized membrane protein YhaH (DUF805 family)